MSDFVSFNLRPSRLLLDTLLLLSLAQENLIESDKTKRFTHKKYRSEFFLLEGTGDNLRLNTGEGFKYTLQSWEACGLSLT